MTIYEILVEIKKAIISHHEEVKKTEAKIERDAEAFQKRADELLKRIQENQINDKLQ